MGTGWRLERCRGNGGGAELTGQVTALDAFQIAVGPEQFPQPVVQRQGDWADQPRGEQRLALRPVQRRPLDLRRALLHRGEVHVPAGGREGVVLKHTPSWI